MDLASRPVASVFLWCKKCCKLYADSSIREEDTMKKMPYAFFEVQMRVVYLMYGF